MRACSRWRPLAAPHLDAQQALPLGLLPHAGQQRQQAGGVGLHTVCQTVHDQVEQGEGGQLGVELRGGGQQAGQLLEGGGHKLQELRLVKLPAGGQGDQVGRAGSSSTRVAGKSCPHWHQQGGGGQVWNCTACDVRPAVQANSCN